MAGSVTSAKYTAAEQASLATLLVAHAAGTIDEIGA